MEIKNTSKELIDSIKKRIDDDRDRYEIQGEDYYYDSEEKKFIFFYDDDVDYYTLEQEINNLVFNCVEDDDYADCLIEAIKHDYEGTARYDLLSFVCDKYDKDFYKVNDRW